jgi:hypothetical protein
VRVSGDATRINALAFSLPDDTAPGEMDAEVTYGNETRAAVVDVLPRRRVRVQPQALTVQSGSKRPLEGVLDVSNRGNAAVELQGEQTITLRPAGALARGVRSAFKKPGVDLPGRLITLGERLAAEKTAELVATISSDARTLDPGGQAQVVLSASLPSALEPGTAWTGRVALFGTTVPITVEVAAAAGTEQQEG